MNNAPRHCLLDRLQISKVWILLKFKGASSTYPAGTKKATNLRAQVATKRQMTGKWMHICKHFKSTSCVYWFLGGNKAWYFEALDWFKRWFQEVKKRSSPILPPVWAVSGDPGKEFDVAGLCIFQIRRNPTMTEQASKEFRQKKQTHYTHSKIISQYLPCVVNYLL